MNMEKYVKDGEVAVLISPDFGAGWSTWAHDEEVVEVALFHPKFVQAALDGVKDISPIVDEILGEGTSFYTGGWEDIQVVWVPVGSRFRVSEYDGSESLIFLGEEGYHTA